MPARGAQPSTVLAQHGTMRRAILSLIAKKRDGFQRLPWSHSFFHWHDADVRFSGGFMLTASPTLDGRQRPGSAPANTRSKAMVPATRAPPCHCFPAQRARESAAIQYLPEWYFFMIGASAIDGRIGVRIPGKKDIAVPSQHEIFMTPLICRIPKFGWLRAPVPIPVFATEPLQFQQLSIRCFAVFRWERPQRCGATFLLFIGFSLGQLFRKPPDH
jgi:hypothetical protein